MNKLTIPIFFTIDNGFAPYVSVAIKSLLKNASSDYFYLIHIVHEDLSEDNKKRLSKLQTKNSKIIFSEMQNDLECITDRMGNRLRADIFSLSIFYRIFIPEMFPEFAKAIYIDSDTVITGDISKLYNIDLEGNLIGAIADTSIMDVKILTDYTKEAVGVPCPKYINSGVLVFDMDKLREKGLASKFLYLLNKYQFDCIAPDQDYINVLCKDQIKYIDDSWDAMPVEGKEEMANPNLIHYNLFAKPWHYADVAYSKYFWEYAKETDYYEELKEELASFDGKDKDNECMALMLDRASKITNSEETFNKVFASGKETRL